MAAVDQFLAALAQVESANYPKAWGDGGCAMGRWQVHPDRLFYEAWRCNLKPALSETWDSFVNRVLRSIYARAFGDERPDRVAMYWHLGHWTHPTASDWDLDYARRFSDALAAQGG